MKHRVVLDTNIIISALMFGGKPEQVYQKILNGECDAYISREIFEEIAGVLSRKKFGFTEAFLQLLEEEMKSYFHWVAPITKIKTVCRDEEDHKIIECALAGKAHFIITGDQDLLTLHPYKNIQILNPEDYLLL